MTTTPLHIALVGATGAVGQECLQILEQRRFPVASLRPLASARSAGKELAFAGKKITVQELGPRSFEGVDIAFFAAGSDTSKTFAPIAAQAGALAVDKSSAYRGDAITPLVIPEVNADHAKDLIAGWRASPRRGGIVAVPNCSTIILLVALEPLRRAFGVDRAVVSTYQAASGAGAAAMEELEHQTADVLAGRPATPRVFKEPCAFNVFSHDSSMDAATGSNSEEAKFTSETRKIWGDPGVKINATCVRVGVLRGHSESVCLTLAKPAGEAEVRAALGEGRTITIVDDRAQNRFPTPLKATGGDTVLVGRIRPDPTQESGVRAGVPVYRGFNLFISGDQLRLGAALTAVKIAELITGVTPSPRP